MNKPFQISAKDLQSSRQTVINWPSLVQAVVDGYRSNGRGVPHGVQKDGVQNGWDARKDRRKAKGWAMRFKLIEKDRLNLFCIEDHGTYGLTGRVLKPEELQEDLLSRERWGRFENLAFTKEPTEGTLGSRGRGKFIFVGASENHTILYETLRGDGVYRFGFRTVKPTESPVNAFNNEEGKNKFVEYTRGTLTPLQKVGTRIVIVNPTEELIADTKQGRFARYIGETWWEIISKFNVDIKVAFNNKEANIVIPDEFVLNAKETKERKVWHKKLQELNIGGQTYRVKELYVVCDKKNPVSEDVRGIAVQRGGMKVCSVQMDYAPKEIAQSLFGYITLDERFDTALLTDEGVEHYTFDFRKQLPGALRRYIQDELAEFGRQKLGLGVDPRRLESERRTNAEKRALTAINRIAGKLGLFKKGPGFRPPGPPPPPPPFIIKLEMPYINFPEGINRVDYGGKLDNIELRAISRKDRAVKTRIQMFMLFGDSIVKKILDKDFMIEKKKKQLFGPESEEVHRSIYTRPGKYTLRARMISLEAEDKGALLDQISRHFYVEQDPPPLGGIFEDCKNADFPEEAEDLMGYTELGSRRGSYILVYNRNHRAKKAVDQSEDDLTDYIFRLMALSLSWIDLRENSGDPKLFMKPASGKLDGEQVAKQTSDVVSRILHMYYGE